jgi:hypothetical protein
MLSQSFCRGIQTELDPKRESGFLQRDGSEVEFGGNTPSGGKFAVPRDMHDCSADRLHAGPSGFKIKPFSYDYEDGDDNDE